MTMKNGYADVRANQGLAYPKQDGRNSGSRTKNGTLMLVRLYGDDRLTIEEVVLMPRPPVLGTALCKKGIDQTPAFAVLPPLGGLPAAEEGPGGALSSAGPDSR